MIRAYKPNSTVGTSRDPRLKKQSAPHPPTYRVQHISIKWLEDHAIPDLQYKIKELDDQLEEAVRDKENIDLQMNAIEALEGKEAAIAQCYGHINIRLRLDYRIEEATNLKSKHAKMLKSLIAAKGQLHRLHRNNPGLNKSNPDPIMPASPTAEGLSLIHI